MSKKSGIPFVEETNIAQGDESRIQLFAEIAAEGKAVPLEWLLSQLGGIKRASLPSLVSRYGYSLRSVTFKEKVNGSDKGIKLAPKSDDEETSEMEL